MKTIIFSLRELLEQRKDKGQDGIDEIKSYLSTFHCEKDTDIEWFLHNRSIEFENLLKSRTYLICDRDKFEAGELVVVGYFALSLKVLVLPEEMSNRSRKEYDGFSGKIHGLPVREIPCYLIGQLGRNSMISSADFPGNVLIDTALAVIDSAVTAVGGRWVLIECRNDKGLIKFYEDNGFLHIMDEPEKGEGDKSTPMIQMIRKVA